MNWATQENLLNFLEERVERHIQDGIYTFQNLPEKELHMPASDGGWSIAQCLEHLNTYGYFYLPLIKKELANPMHTPAIKTYKNSWLGNYFIRMVEPETGKKKQKAFVKHIPSANLDAHAVVAEFIRQQEDLLQSIKKARLVDLNTIRIPVSFTRWIQLKLGDLLHFMVAHNERHILQARILLSNSPGRLKAAY